MQKRLSTLLALILVLSVLLAACGQMPTPSPTPQREPETQATEPQATSAVPTATQPPQTTITITMWEQEESFGRDVVLYPLIDEFMAANPDIVIAVTHYGNEELRNQFQSASLAGAAPDIIRCPGDFAGLFSTMGLLLPVTDIFDQAFLDTFFPGALAGGTVAGTLWGVPECLGGCLMLVYNKDLVAVPPSTTDDMVMVAQAATDEAAGKWGLVFNIGEPFWLVPWLGGFGGWMLDKVTDMPTLDTPAMIDALQFLRDLSLTHKVIPQGCDHETSRVLFGEGKAAMLIDGEWALNSYAQKGIDLGTAPLPMVSQTGLWPTPMTEGRYFMVGKHVMPGTPESEAVTKFVKFMTGEHAQEMWLESLRKMPSNRKVAESSPIQQDPILAGVAAQLERGRGRPAALQFRCFWDSVYVSLRDVLGGSLLPQEAARKMQEDADRCIKDSGLGPKKKLKVGLITDVGKVNDGTFNESAYRGMIRAVEEFGLESAFIESVAEADYKGNIERLAQAGYDVIITVGYMLKDATLAMAAKYPDINFAAVDQPQDAEVINVAGLVFREDQAGFLAGCLAGLMTESNVVGIVAGMEIPPVVRFRQGYENGVQHVNPECMIRGVHVDSFTDPVRGKEEALLQIAEGADVIFGAGGQTGSGSILAAAQEGVYVIGVDQDEYVTTFARGTAKGADRVLSSAVKRVDVAVYTAIRNAVMDDWQGGNLHFEAANDGVGLAPFHRTEDVVPEEVKTKLEEIAEGLKEGKVETGVALE